MEIDAATLYNYLGKRYEDAYGDNPYLCEIINRAMKMLKPGSRILDVGCGTGKPVAEMLTRNGHEVHGIDVSEEMVKIAQRQIGHGGTFEKADMRKFTPPRIMDGVFAVYSLYQISPSDIYSAIFRFAGWLREGGILVLGTTPSTSLPKGLGEYDPVWNCMKGVRRPWMTRITKQTFLSEDGWENLLQHAGFSIEATQAFKFTPKDHEHKRTEVHYFTIARKMNLNPLLGPYPLPKIYPGPRPRHDAIVKRLQSRLAIEECHNVVKDAMRYSQKMLDVGGWFGSFQVYSPKTLEKFDMLSENLPFPDRSFDSAFAMFTLDHVNDLERSLQELTRVVDRSMPYSRIVIVQGAPANECLKLMNSVCVPLSAQNPRISHQGYLLHTAKNVLTDMGFGDIRVERINSHYVFSENEEESCRQAAGELAGLWHQDDPNCAQMKGALLPHLRELFVEHQCVLRNVLAVLVARPLPN